MTTTTDNGPAIVDRRTASIVRLGGKQEWVVNVFGDGRVMLVCRSSAGITFQAHFEPDQWVDLQKLIGGER